MASGTISTGLMMDILALNFAGVNEWDFTVSLSHSMDDYKLIGFALHRANKKPYSSPQVFIPVSQFKSIDSSDPVRVHFDLSDPSNVHQGAFVCYVNSTTVGFYLGEDFTPDIRLAVFGVK